MAPGSPTPLRVEVVPVGYYIDRIVEPIKTHRADRVYLVRARSDQEDLAASFREAVTRELRRWNRELEIRIVKTDLWTMESAVETFSAVILRERSDHNLVWVNLSTGSKLEAVAAAIACMAHGGTPYYVRMRSYRHPGPRRPLAEGVESIDLVPTFALSSPTSAGLAVLQLLGENQAGLRKKALISGLIELGLIDEETASKTVQARYAKLQSILERLTQDPPMVVVEGRRKAALVRITDRGRLALRIYAPRLGLGDSP
jgi:hypothetical protein